MQDKLTGKTRHRVLVRLFRKPLLVLQYQVYGFIPEYTGGGSVDGEYGTWWIDARVEFLMEGEVTC